MTTKKNTYADRFFGKLKAGGQFGSGFIGIITKGRREKPDRPFKPMVK